MTTQRQQPRLETATVEINGGLYDVARQAGETMWRGDLCGEDADTGEVWRMGFWLPGAAVAEMCAVAAAADAGGHPGGKA